MFWLDQHFGEEMSFQKRLFQVIETAQEGDKLSRVFDLFLISLIILNIIAVIVSTVDSIQLSYGKILRTFEIVSVIIFSIEYLLRIWSIVLKKKYSSPITGRVKYVFSPMAIIDLLAILPFYIPLLIPIDLRFLRGLRLFRLFRLIKIGRYSVAMSIVTSIFKRKKPELTIVFGIILILLIVSSSLMYYVENSAQPDSFGSIPETLWWSVCTLTTVGYGDMTPSTPLGKACGGFIALLGIGMFALPAGILAAGFEEEMKTRGSSKFRCPHCNNKLVLTEDSKMVLLKDSKDD